MVALVIGQGRLSAADAIKRSGWLTERW